MANNIKKSKIKSEGITYTPPDLASFVANTLVGNYSNLQKNKSKPIRVLDPCIGAGALTYAVLEKLYKNGFVQITIIGLDINSNSFNDIHKYLVSKYPTVNIQLIEISFYDFYSQNTASEFDIIIANPPYIRTQSLSANDISIISNLFKLTGKIDAYQVFLIGLVSILSNNGCMATITSNKFLNTLSGKSTRDFLSNNINITQLYDLGDTKPFPDASVLPLLMFAQKASTNDYSEFKSLYSTYEQPQSLVRHMADIYQAIVLENSQYIKINKDLFYLNVGTIDIPQSQDNIWRISNHQSDIWLNTVRANTVYTFGDLFDIRVGVKSTADKIFIKTEQYWQENKIEPELLRDLITSDYANNFLPNENILKEQIFYPYVIFNGKKSIVDIINYPFAYDYMINNKAQLSARQYLIDSGRAWYELWVPQDVTLWPKPKIIWVDISDKPKFWLDTTGSIVNGECFWMIPKANISDDFLYMALAVANSPFIEKFYDSSFNNKLYAGRRRYTKQYVSHFPIPDINNPNCKEIIRLVKLTLIGEDRQAEIYRLIEKIFTTI